MGEVYRARDTKLHRDVALKILPDLFAADPERLARFEREAYPNNDLVRLLKVAIQIGPGVKWIRFSKNVINGQFIDDALIYGVA